MTSVQILNTSTELNFEINHSDSPLQEYKILMDFLETFAVGDIFTFISSGEE